MIRSVVVSKKHYLKNGCVISDGRFYNGIDMETRICIWTPDGKLYASCDSYAKAYEIASHLKVTENNELITANVNFL